MGPSLRISHQLAVKKPKRSTHHLLGTGLALETSFKESGDLVSKPSKMKSSHVLPRALAVTRSVYQAIRPGQGPKMTRAARTSAALRSIVTSLE